MYRLEAYNTSYEEKLKIAQEDLTRAQQRISQFETALQSSQEQVDKHLRDLLDALKKLADAESAQQSATNAKTELLRQLQTRQNKIEALEDDIQVIIVHH